VKGFHLSRLDTLSRKLPVAMRTTDGGVQISGYARATYASSGGGASRVLRIAGDVTVGSALVSCVLMSYAPCAGRLR
jgi:hypothetical protein